MAKSNRPAHVSKPTYPGGVKAMQAFIKKHLRYPEAARTEKVEGTVTVRYSLDYTGKVVATKIKKGIGHGCDAEAARVVRLLTFTVPQSSKRKVRIHQDIQVHFRLPKVKAKAKPTGKAPMTIEYSTSGRTKAKQNDKPAGGGYGYTISW